MSLLSTVRTRTNRAYLAVLATAVLTGVNTVILTIVMVVDVVG